MFKYIGLIIVLVSFLFGACGLKNSSGPKTKKVIIEETAAGHYQLFVDGKPLFIKGAGCEFGNIETLASHGANSFRTWRTDNKEHTGQEILDKAQEQGLLVMMGIDIQRERHGFDYNNPESVKKQLEYIKAEIQKYKNHPALLGWGIGNELNLNAENMKVWDAVNEISKMIHQIDPNHPTTTMLAGINKKEIDYFKVNCTDLDFISIQMYGDIVNLQKRISDAGYDGPYVVTEWGATGHWEVRTTEWGAPIEQTSQEKAASFIQRYRTAIEADSDRCLGSYAFLWGQKQERTPTWYGMFLESGERTETVDAMHLIWNGAWPENRCPTIDSLQIDGEKAYECIKFNTNQTVTISAWARDYENDSLTYRWEILTESTSLGEGGDYEDRPKTWLNKIGKPTIQIQTPKTKGAYRLFVYITDKNNGSATANIPFLVN